MKMRKVAILMVLAVFLVSGQVGNTIGWGLSDTITDLAADSTSYSAAFELSVGEDIRLLLKMDDTTETGYANDSIEFRYAFQTGTVTTDTAGDKDTAWCEPLIRLDTITSSNLGVLGDTTAYVDSTGTVHRNTGGIDTLSVNGWAVCTKWFEPEWDELVRYWFEALTDMDPEPIELILEVHRRDYVQTRRP